MRRLLDVGLEELTTILFKMGGIAEEAVGLSIEGFLEGVDVSEKVQSLSAVLVTLSVDAEDKTFELLVKYQPVASDLRVIKSYMKIAYDFERYGRYALDISFDHKTFAELRKDAFTNTPLQKLAEKVIKMVQTSVTAFKNHDAELARKLAGIEDEVDKLYMSTLKQYSKTSFRDNSLISKILVTRYLERIADHATYIGESVVYIATGERVTLR